MICDLIVIFPMLTNGFMLISITKKKTKKEEGETEISGHSNISERNYLSYDNFVADRSKVGLKFL